MATVNKGSLSRARKTRSQIARLFLHLEQGDITVTELLGSRPQCLERIRVYDVLRRVPHLDRTGAEKVLRNAQVWPLTKWGDLTVKQRQRILMHLPPRVQR
jgi:hypothetical protein